MLPSNDLMAVKKHLATVGPLAVNLDASHFHLVSEKIQNGTCRRTQFCGPAFVIVSTLCPSYSTQAECLPDATMKKTSMLTTWFN